MKRGIIIFVLLSVIFSLSSINVGAITGAASSQEQGVSVFVLPAVPVLNIISPENKTYEEGEYILLDYQAILIDTIWYNLDNTANITINSSFYFTTTIGSHTLYLYGNHSNGTIYSDEVTFYVGALKSGGGKKEVIINETIPITLEKERIDVSLKQGESKTVRLLIRNDYTETVKVDLKKIGLENLLASLSETEFYLNIGESREIYLNFAAAEDIKPDLYIGKLFVSTKTTQKEILIAVEVESLGFLFDVSVDIPKEPMIFKPGEEITSIIKFYNLGAIGQQEVNIEYLIKDEQGNIVFGEKQVLIIGPSISITKVFKLPDNINEGNYIYYVKATYDSKIASASKWFSVLTEPLFINKYGNALAKLIAIIVACYIALYILSRLAIICKKGFYAGKRRKREYKTFREYKKRTKKRIK